MKSGGEICITAAYIKDVSTTEPELVYSLSENVNQIVINKLVFLQIVIKRTD